MIKKTKIFLRSAGSFKLDEKIEPLSCLSYHFCDMRVTGWVTWNSHDKEFCISNNLYALSSDNYRREIMTYWSKRNAKFLIFVSISLTLFLLDQSATSSAIVSILLIYPFLITSDVVVSSTYFQSDALLLAKSLRGVKWWNYNEIKSQYE